MTCLVLIDKQNRVRGDTAVLASHSFAWVYASAWGKNAVEDLATVAARLLDAKLGQTGGAYTFSSFASKGDSDGYFIFDCGRTADWAPAPFSDNAESGATAAVMTACFYVGYVRRDH